MGGSLGSRPADVLSDLVELQREAEAYRKLLSMPGMELDTLRAAACLTHNCGDVDQAISFWPSGERYAASRARFQRLAHENRTPYEPSDRSGPQRVGDYPGPVAGKDLESGHEPGKERTFYRQVGY